MQLGLYSPVRVPLPIELLPQQLYCEHLSIVGNIEGNVAAAGAVVISSRQLRFLLQIEAGTSKYAGCIASSAAV